MLSFVLVLQVFAGPKKIPSTTVTTIVGASADQAFRYIVPIELAHIFKRYKRLPAVVRTDEAAKWETAGLTRTVYFEDGTTARETLLTVVPHQSFSYKVEQFSSSLRLLAQRVEGQWTFTDLGDGRTKIEWTYKVIPRSIVGRWVLNGMVMKDIKGLLTNALAIIRADLERMPAPPRPE